MKHRYAFVCWLACGLLGAALVGCGGGRGSLSGKVTYEGKALRFGSVGALGSDGQTRNSVIKQDGTYEIQDIAAGPVKLLVMSADPAESLPKMRKKDEAPPKVDNKGWFPIPNQYLDFEKSGLTTTVRSGENKHDIDLKYARDVSGEPPPRRDR
jgi:hypothetical protein